MTDESEELSTAAARMGFENWGRIVGLEMIIRALLAERANQADYPTDFLDEFRDGLLSSMVQKGRDGDAIEALLIEHAEAQINDVFENVRKRFA